MSKQRMNSRKDGVETGAGMGNRTGIALAPEMALDLIREAQRTPPNPKGDARLLAEYRGSYIKEKVPMGSKPAPLKSVGEAGEGGALQALLLDKLGERLAFERQGTRLYECLVGKVRLAGKAEGGPSVADLEHILNEEREHFEFLQQAIVDAGGDPAALTPCANVASVLSQGIVQIVADPRSTVAQCLEAVLNAELADNDGWSLLARIAPAAGSPDLPELIETAMEREAEHLERVRGWLAEMLAGKSLGSGRSVQPATAVPQRAPTPTRASRPAPAARKRSAARPRSKIGAKSGAKSGTKSGAKAKPSGKRGR